jgi:hypothetical protein
MRFHTTIEGAGKTAAGMRIPPEVVAALGTSRKPAVKVTINSYTHRSTVAVVSGAFMVGVPPVFRNGAGVAAGDEVEVEIELDTEPRVISVPPELAAALDGDPDAMRTFDALSYSNKRRLVEPITAAKAAETRQRRIDKTVALLHDGRS